MRTVEPEAQSLPGRGACVIYTPRSSVSSTIVSGDAPTPPPQLTRELLRRSLSVTTRGVPAEALADMVLFERRLRRGEAPGLFMLLFLEPDNDPQALALLQSARLYAPHAGLWRYCPTERPALRAWNPDPVPCFPDPAPAKFVAPLAAPSPSVSTAISTFAKPLTLRLAGMGEELPGLDRISSVRTNDTPTQQRGHEEAVGMDRGESGGGGRGGGGVGGVGERGGSANSVILPPHDRPSGMIASTPSPTPPPLTPPAGVILSQDEMAMLLSDDWESHT